MNTRATATILLLVSLFTVVTANAAPLTITFQKSAAVENNNIRLGDLVLFDQHNDTTMALASLVIGESPQPGERVLLRSVTIRNTLLRSHAIPGGTKWRGSGTVSVLRKGSKVESQQILHYIEEYIAANEANLPAAKIRFLPKSMPLPFSVPTGELSCEVLPSRPGILRSTRFSLIFRIGDRVVKNMSVQGRVEALAEVVVASKTLTRGQEISTDDLTTIPLDISRIPDAVTSKGNVLGKRLNRNLRPQQPLRAIMLEEIPVIFKGEPVKISIRSGSMLLTATGHAVTNGVKNQVIRVQNSSSSKILRARVIGPGHVEIKI